MGRDQLSGGHFAVVISLDCQSLLVQVWINSRLWLCFILDSSSFFWKVFQNNKLFQNQAKNGHNNKKKQYQSPTNLLWRDVLQSLIWGMFTCYAVACDSTASILQTTVALKWTLRCSCWGCTCTKTWCGDAQVPRYGCRILPRLSDAGWRWQTVLSKPLFWDSPPRNKRDPGINISFLCVCTKKGWCAGGCVDLCMSCVFL